MAEYDKQLLITLLSQVRADFDRLRWQAMPIRAHLLHKATNAEAEGVQGTPQPHGELVAGGGAGHRDPGQRLDELGNPVFREDPIVDVKGNPIVNSAGQAFDFVMPAFRSITFLGRSEDYHHLHPIAERAGRIIGDLQDLPLLTSLAGWSFSAPTDLWWGLLFELAWRKLHPLLVAEKRLWLPSDQPNSFVPYDLDKLNSLAISMPPTFAERIPKNWLKRLPDAWVSDLDNVVTGCLDATDFILAQLAPAAAEKPLGIGSEALEKSEMVTMKRRFAIAFSFPGERRQFVEKVASAVKAVFGEHRTFYDNYHREELSRPNLDITLQSFYKDESDLVVVFVCKEYNEKEWCGLEWRAIRELIKNRERRDEDVMFLAFDKELPDGMLSIDGYLPISEMSEREVADSVLKRWCGTH